MNSSEKAKRASRLRNMISTDCPVINQANWKFLNPKGWRWECNLDIEEDDSIDIIRGFQIKCGVDRVTIGHMFDADNLHPHKDPDVYGVYIKDVEDLVSTFIEKLDDPEIIEVWLARRI